MHQSSAGMIPELYDIDQYTVVRYQNSLKSINTRILVKTQYLCLRIQYVIERHATEIQMVRH